VIGTIAVSWHPSFSIAFGLSIVNWLRLYHLLPHESAWLRRAQKHAQQLNFDAALATLSRKPVLSGYTAEIQARMIEVRTLLHAGNHLKAQQVSAGIDTSAFTQEEKVKLRTLRAFFYQKTGDLRAFIKIARSFDDENIRRHTECALLKSEALLLDERLADAQECLEARIGGTQNASELFKLYNNLARGEEIAGRRKQKLAYLRKAWHEWKQAPEPAALEYLAHNLAIETARDGGLEEASAIVQDALQRIDRSQPDQVLMWHNLSVEVARQAGDLRQLKVAHSKFNELSVSLDHTAAQRLTLKITRLRMDFNDGLAGDFQKFPEKINALLDDIDQLAPSDQLSALKEIGHNIEQVTYVNQHSPWLMQKIKNSLARNDKMALERAHQVNAQLETLPPSLVNQRQHWLSLQHYVEKIRIRKESAFPGLALENLFKSQKEIAELHLDRGLAHTAIRAWIVLCGEYVAYTEQFPSPWSFELRRRYEQTAIDALKKTKLLLEQQKITHGLEDAMIGVAEFALKLNNDKETARYWVGQFDKNGNSLNHYAHWFREKYHWVKSAIA